MTSPSPEEARAAEPYDFEAVHTYFGLTYANYLVLHRTRLQSMPDEWQRKFVALLVELDDALELPEGAHGQSYAVQVREPSGKFGRERIPHYNRGRTRLPLAAPVPVPSTSSM